MPVTHLNNFLNITVGGPYYFLEQNLLRFPQPMNPSSIFGTAIHDSIESIVKYKKIHNKDISEKILIDNFISILKKHRLPKTDYLKQEERGVFILKRYLAKYGKNLKADDIVEFDFKGEGITINKALITGKIDYLKIEGDSILVLDFKTGKTLSSWEPKDEYDKIKAHHYKYQLIMYKILIESSSKFRGKKIKSLGLQFVEDENIFVLYYEPTEEEVARFKKLVEKVYDKIVSVDFGLNDDFREKTKLSEIIEYEDSILKA
jgi:RecB family exonuclease